MLNNAKVMVTGGASMVGGAICSHLESHNAVVDPVPHNQCDLLNYDQINKRMQDFAPDYVIHAAGWNGGIGWNKQFPATIYYRTAQMALNVYQAACENKIKKVVGLLASCSYPDLTVPVLQEDSLWSGLPNPTVECHGLSKRIIADFGRQITKQWDTLCVACVLNNCYGPLDSFHPDKTKVVGAMIRRFVEAKQNGLDSVTCWGTGAPLRDFVYAPDAGKAVVSALVNYDNSTLPINVTSGVETSIKDLTTIVANEVGYEGQILWDTTKQDGQMRKNLSTTQFNQMHDMSFTPLAAGLKQTIQWYIDNKEYADAKGF